MDRPFRAIAYRPVPVLAAVVVASLAAGLVLVDVRTLEPRLRIETAVEKILPTGGVEQERYARFRERFGNDEILLVGMVTDDVFTAENLRRIDRMTRLFSRVDGIRQVVSLSNAPDIRAEGGEVAIRTVYDEVPEDPAQLRALRERVLANPVHVGSLVSADGRAAAFLVYPLEMSEAEFRRREIDREIEAIAREVAPGARILLAGTPPLKAATSRILLRDLFRFVPLGYVFMAAVAFAIFRSARGVVIPLGGITLAQLWTLALLVSTGRSLNLVTFIVPPLINAVGFAYAVHVVSEHEDQVRAGERGPEAVRRALAHVASPLLLTALTTAAGFLSLCLSRLPAIREFGAFCVVGVLGSCVAALTFAPALLSLLPDPTPSALPGGTRLERFATRTAGLDVRHRRAVLVATVLVACVATYGLTRIQVSTSFTSNLKSDHPLRRAIDGFDEHLAGSISLHVVLEADEPDAFKHPEMLHEVRAVQAWLDAQPEVTDTTSLADYLMVVNQAFQGGEPEHFAIPAHKRLISQFLFFVWHPQLEAFVDGSFSSTDILVRIPARPSQYTAGLMDRIEARLERTPESLRAYVTGDTPLIVRTIDDISWGQAASLSGAIGIIFAILVAYFRSLRVAALALAPNALPVLVYFGVLGLTGVTLNVITSLIACIVLGIAVDDTIHFLARFREQARELGDEGKAAVAALQQVVRPVTATTAALCAGFLVLALSGLRHQVEFGILATCMLAFAWLVDVTFTPALCARLGLDSGHASRDGPP